MTSRHVDEDLATAAERLLDGPARAHVRDRCRARIDEELAWIAEDGSRAKALQAARPRFDHERR